MEAEPGAFLRRLFETAVGAADPARCVPPHLPEPGDGRTVVIGAGKAAAAMAAAVESAWADASLTGLVVTRYGHGLPCRHIEVVEAGHPYPDDAGLAAAKRILACVRALAPEDRLLCLLSGGGSALLTLPAAGVSVSEKRAVNRSLLRLGANIHEINCVRKHLSAIKGGRLALAAAPAPVLTLIISDVPGDDPAVIASGPTVADPTTCADALAILDRYRIGITPALRDLLQTGELETPKPGDPRLVHADHRIIARPADSLAAAASLAAARGFEVVNLGDRVEGEARDVGAAHARRIREMIAASSANRPLALLSGGETTVTVRGDGRGGRNMEYLLSLAIALDGVDRIHALAADTDGIDGSEDAAGAWFGPGLLEQARRLGHDPRACLDRNDAWALFAACERLVVSGPTRTNVNDFRAILYLPERHRD